MSKIISVLLEILNRINKFIWKIILFLSKFIKVEDLDKLNNKPSDERYRQFKVDEPAIIEPFVTIEHKNHKQLIKDNNINPVKRRNGKQITIDVKCPCCGAPKDYLYDNTGKQNQFLCKVCSYLFNINSKNEDVVLKCPHCRHVLDHRISREDFDVYFCRNPKCSYYLNNLASLTLADKKKFEENPTLFKLHYVYRKFNIDFPTLQKDYRDFIKTPIDISRAYSSDYIIGLCLTYHVNYGLSYRQTSLKIEDLIYEIRGKQVMLDRDLAQIYKCTNGTKDINKAVKRNIEKFPKDFYFRLTEDDIIKNEQLRSRFQNGTLNIKRGQNIKYMPHVFNEEGVAMLSSVLKTSVAAEVSVNIMRAFVAMRRFINNNKEIFTRVITIENDIKFLSDKQKETENNFKYIFDKLEKKEDIKENYF